METERPSQADLLRKYGLRLDKRLGQHFLVDRGVLDRIVKAIGQLGATRVIELGAGAGALSFRLLDAGFRVKALELDGRFVALLQGESKGEELEVEQTDLAREDFERFVAGSEALVFAGNLPYQVTSSVLFGLLPALRRVPVRGAVLMMQAEVAKRLVAGPGSKTYGVLSVLLQAELRVNKLFGVRPGCFLPPPAVDSAVVELRPRADRVELGESGRGLVKDLFAQRRKQIGGLLRRYRGVPVEAIARMSSELGLDPHQRAESLRLEDFVNLDRWLDRQDVDG